MPVEDRCATLGYGLLLSKNSSNDSGGVVEGLATVKGWWQYCHEKEDAINRLQDITMTLLRLKMS